MGGVAPRALERGENAAEAVSEQDVAKGLKPEDGASGWLSVPVLRSDGLIPNRSKEDLEGKQVNHYPHFCEVLEAI